MMRASVSPFSPSGRRWSGGSDEGAFAAHASVASRSGRSLHQSLTPLSALPGIFSPWERRGHAAAETLQ